MKIFADQYFLEDRNYECDLINFSNYCETKCAPTTKIYYITSTREFFIFYDIELIKKKEWNLKNKIKRGGPVFAMQKFIKS